MAVSKMEVKTIREARDNANAFARLHARELAFEINEWQDTATLCDGKMRELAKILKPIAGCDSLAFAETTANRMIREVMMQLPKKYEYAVVDWSDDAYRANGSPTVVDEFSLSAPLSEISYDGGRLDIDGLSNTIYVSSSQFTIRNTK